MVKPESVSDESMIVITKDIVKKIENELEYPGQIKVNVIREVRTTEYAKQYWSRQLPDLWGLCDFYIISPGFPGHTEIYACETKVVFEDPQTAKIPSV